MDTLVCLTIAVPGKTPQELIDNFKKIAGITTQGLQYDIHSSEQDYNCLDYEIKVDGKEPKT